MTTLETLKKLRDAGAKATQEVWKKIPSHPSYEVSNIGRIRTKKPICRNDKGGKYRMISIVRTGTKREYPSFVPYNNGKRTTALVHRCMLEAFVGPCPDGMEACHNDGNPSNNILNNLRWDTRSNNTIDQIKHGTHYLTIRASEDHTSAKLNNEKVRNIRHLLMNGFSQGAVARMYGVAQPTIHAIRERRTWKNT